MSVQKEKIKAQLTDANSKKNALTKKNSQLREVKTSTPIEVVKVDEGSNSTKPKKKGWWST